MTYLVLFVWVICSSFAIPLIAYSYLLYLYVSLLLFFSIFITDFRYSYLSAISLEQSENCLVPNLQLVRDGLWCNSQNPKTECFYRTSQGDCLNRQSIVIFQQFRNNTITSQVSNIFTNIVNPSFQVISFIYFY